MKPRMLKGLLLLFMLCLTVNVNANEKKWYLVTDTEKTIEMSKICSLVAIDTEETFSVLDSQGHVLASGVEKVTFHLLESSDIEDVTIQGEMFEGIVDNVLTLINVKGDIDIFNMNGARMLSVKATNIETSINVSHFTPGVYLLKCGTMSFKFIKK